MLQRHGNSTAALVKYEAALKISPELRDAHNNIGVILSSRFEAGELIVASRARELSASA